MNGACGLTKSQDHTFLFLYPNNSCGIPLDKGTTPLEGPTYLPTRFSFSRSGSLRLVLTYSPISTFPKFSSLYCGRYSVGAFPNVASTFPTCSCFMSLSPFMVVNLLYPYCHTIGTLSSHFQNFFYKINLTTIHEYGILKL